MASAKPLHVPDPLPDAAEKLAQALDGTKLDSSYVPYPANSPQLTKLRSGPQPTGTAPAVKPTPADAGAQVQVVTPWDVQGSVTSDGRQLAIDYDKLLDQFGTRKIDAALLERFEKVTGKKPHPFLKRGLFFSHR